MAERKVLNKYIPPDFDPTKLPRGVRPKNDQVVIRMMLPMSVGCQTCGEFMYKGKKFNAKKECVKGETYLGIKIWRFYMKCVRCNSEFTIKTDPKNTDYACEVGVSRNFEPWRDRADQEEALNKAREEEEAGDAMKALENRTLDSKREMDVLDALDELRTMNARNSKLDDNTLLEELRKKMAWEAQRQAKMDEEDEAEIASVFGLNLPGSTVGSETPSSGGLGYVKRLTRTDEEKAAAEPAPSAPSAPAAPTSLLAEKPKQEEKKGTKRPAGVVVRVVKKAKTDDKQSPTSAPANPLAALAGYDSD